jgi:MYXO-CTERM domain-containing protein
MARGQSLVGAGTASLGGGTRSTMFANGRYWVFYDNGSGVVYTSTTDGINFAAPLAASTTPQTDGFTTAVNPTNGKVGVAWSNQAPAGTWTFYYREGTFGAGTITFSAPGIVSQSANIRGRKPALTYFNGQPALADFESGYAPGQGCGKQLTDIHPVGWVYSGTTWVASVECSHVNPPESRTASAAASVGTNVLVARNLFGSTGIQVLSPAGAQLYNNTNLGTTVGFNLDGQLSVAQELKTVNTDVHTVYQDQKNVIGYGYVDGINFSGNARLVAQTNLAAVGAWPTLSRMNGQDCFTVAYTDGATAIHRTGFTGTARGGNFVQTPDAVVFTGASTLANLSSELDSAYMPAMVWQDGPNVYFGWAPGGATPVSLSTSPAAPPADGATLVTVTSTAFTDACGNTLPAGTHVTISATAGTITSADVDAATPGIQVALGAGGVLQFTVKAAAVAGTATLAGMLTSGGGGVIGSVTFGSALPLGAQCTLSAQCASGHCSPAFDGSPKSYCTSVACGGCQGGNTSGACVNALAGTDPNAFCSADPTGICQPGNCDGAGACQLAPATTDCGTTCTSTTQFTQATCNASGMCLSTVTNCCPYACGGSSCNTFCLSDADCCAGAGCVYGACVNGAAPVLMLLSSPPPANLYQPYHYQPPNDRVMASGTAPITFSVTGGGATIDPTTGQLYFIPTTSGNVILKLTATNAFGSDTQNLVIAVGPPQPPVIAHDANATAQVGSPYVLNTDGMLHATGSLPMAFQRLSGPAELHLDPATGRVDWVPALSGNVSITLGATNAWGTDSYTFSVAVAQPGSQSAPTASLTATPSSGPSPLVVALDSSGSHAAGAGMLVGRSLTFGDGTPPTTAVTATHTYPAGAYVARLVVQDQLGQSATALVGIQSAQDGVLPPLVTAVADPSTGVAPLTVQFHCECSGAQGAQLLWDFGDGEQSGMDTPMHVYANPGGYQVTLTALDPNSGALGTDSVFVSVSAPGGDQPPMVRAFADPVTGDAPLTVKFASQLADPDGRVVSFEWSLGEGDSSTDASPTKTFTEPGIYHVELRALDDAGLQSSASVDVQVTKGGVLPPKLLSKPQLTAAVGVAYQYRSGGGQPEARGGRPLQWSLGKMVNGALSNAPTGMLVDPASGAITWTPTADQVGSQPVTLVVQNSAGTDFQDFVVEVQGGAPSGGCGCAVGGAGPIPWSALSLLLVAGVLMLARRRDR